MVACLVPWSTAMVGLSEAPAAGIASTGLFFYILWLQMGRPPTMHRKVGVGLWLTAAGFVMDAALTGRLWRLAGAGVSAALAVKVLALPAPARPGTSS